MGRTVDLTQLRKALSPKRDADDLTKAMRPEEEKRQDADKETGMSVALFERFDRLEEGHADLHKKLDVAINLLSEIKQMEAVEQENAEESANDGGDGDDILEKGLHSGEYNEILELFQGTHLYADALELLAKKQRLGAERDLLWAKQTAEQARGPNRFGLAEHDQVGEDDFLRISAEEDEICARLKELEAELLEDAAAEVRKQDDLTKAIPEKEDDPAKPPATPEEEEKAQEENDKGDDESEEGE